MPTPERPPVDTPQTLPLPPASAGRRRLLTGGVAAAALAAGAGWAWWRHRLSEPSSPALDGLWNQTFAAPGGQTEVRMQAFQGKPLLLNFWATWCPPCVEELPMLNAFYAAQQSKGWQVLGLAVDQDAAVQRFLQRLPLAFPVGIAGLSGTQLTRELGNSAGGLPFTVVFGRQGNVQHRKMGQLLASDLQNWASL
jgi:thiol-disulfide isomerase/thioredoxin